VSDPTSPVATPRRRREIVKSLSSWAAAIAAAALGFWLTEGTYYHQTSIAFHYSDVERGRRLDQNILLQSGDTVVVP